jgi:hypothetical protein
LWGACAKDNVCVTRKVIPIPVHAALDASEISAAADALRVISFESEPNHVAAAAVRL